MIAAKFLELFLTEFSSLLLLSPSEISSAGFSPRLSIAATAAVIVKIHIGAGSSKEASKADMEVKRRAKRLQ